MRDQWLNGQMGIRHNIRQKKIDLGAVAMHTTRTMNFGYFRPEYCRLDAGNTKHTSQYSYSNGQYC
jgi:hypothetical protein